MKITVITINYNNLDGLRRTVPSVLSQTYDRYEYVVVDGGSTDGSREYIASRAGIGAWVSEPDRGIYHAMNKAVQMARGEYCLFMNSGDMFFSPRVLEQCAPRLSTYDYLAGYSVHVGEKNAFHFLAPDKLTLGFLLARSLCHQSLFVRTAVLQQCPFNESRRIVSDWEQYLTAWYMHGCTYAPLEEFVSLYFLDGISSVNRRLSEKERDRVIRDLIASGGGKGRRLEQEYERFLRTEADPAYISHCYPKQSEYRHTKRFLQGRKNEKQLKKKLEKALALPKPWLRDLKVVKYGLKFFCKDLFR